MANTNTLGTIRTPSFRSINERRRELRGNTEPSPQARQFSALVSSSPMWAVLYIPALIALVAVGYMVSELRPGPGRVFGAGDSASPNAQLGDK